MEFVYTAKTTTGDVVSGTMEADAPEQVRRHLRAQDLFPMTVTK